MHIILNFYPKPVYLYVRYALCDAYFEKGRGNMRVAVCASDADTRYKLSRMVDDALLRCGLLAEMALFHMLAEVLESANETDFYDLVVTDAGDVLSLKAVCSRSALVLVGDRRDGPDAYDIGARYFIEAPVDRYKIDKALRRCVKQKKG